MAFRYIEERGEVCFGFYAPVEEVRRLGSIISVDNYSDGRAFAYAGEKGFRSFLAERIDFTVYSPPGEWYRQFQTPERQIIHDETGEAVDWDYYPAYTEYIDMMQGWADRYPGISEYIDAGRSVDGRKILFMKITGDNPSSNPRPRFMYSSTMHGDETVGFVLMLRLIDYMLTNYPENPVVEYLLDNLEIWINPLANPDAAYFGGDGNNIVSPRRFNSNNIDLNRDFPGQVEPGFQPVERQPETVVMTSLMDTARFILSANLHGGQEVINYPWDYWERRHPDDGWFEYISREYVDTARYYGPDDYMTFLGGVTNGYQWYPISGGRQDYVTYFTNGREVTMEISLPKHPPSSTLPDYWEYNYRSLLNYMEQATYGIRGRVGDAVTGLPLQARVGLLYHDTDSSAVYSDTQNGWYFRLAEQGSYDIIFSAAGYQSRTIPGVEVRNRNSARLDVVLEPAATDNGPGEVSSYPVVDVFPVPAGDRLSVRIDTGESSYHIRLLLYDRTGRLVRELYNGRPGPGKNLLLSGTDGIMPGLYLLEVRFGSEIVTRKVIISGF